MTTRTLIAEDEYLRTSYDPECEYGDGVLVERNVGTRDHSELQAALTAYFWARRKAWKIHVYPEQRIKVRAERYLVPDLCIILGERPGEQIFTSPPLLWIEILSPEDRPVRINQKVREILAFGVPYIWVIDPETLESELHTQSASRVLDDGILRIDGTPIEVPLGQVKD